MTWECPICGEENPSDVDVCQVCGAYREDPCYDIISDLTDEEADED